jgi:putative ABC transport system permease protein
MKNYLSLVSKYLHIHRKKSRLTLLSIALSVALVTGIFSMFDFLQQFEIRQIMYDYGNYHVSIANPTAEEQSVLKTHYSIKKSGICAQTGDGTINGNDCRFTAIDITLIQNLNISILEGYYPANKDELMIEQWVAQSKSLSPGDPINVTFADKKTRLMTVSGICKDSGHTKATGIPIVFLSLECIPLMPADTSVHYLIEFKKAVAIENTLRDFVEKLGISPERIGRNERLLALIGQSEHRGAIGIYAVGAVLSVIVLIAGVIMIANTFNISVLDRARQFGLLRCIGASRSQIKKLVSREGWMLTFKALPLGLTAGILVAIFCSAVLKYYNQSLFGDFSLFNVSVPGILAGTVIGCLTVFIATLQPANKASKVSPVQAVTGNFARDYIRKVDRQSRTKIAPVEVIMGLRNATSRKKTFVLMTCSFAVSIVMFLGFQVFIDFLYASINTLKPSTPDITVSADHGMNTELYNALSDLSGVKQATRRMAAYINISYEYAKLTDSYTEDTSGIEVDEHGHFLPPEKSFLVSYDSTQLEWAKSDLVEGTVSEAALNRNRGVIAVAMHLRNGVMSSTADLKVGDSVTVFTPTGEAQTMAVVGVIRSVDYSSPVLTMGTFITTEKLFTELTGIQSYQTIDLQVRKKQTEQILQEVQKILGPSVTILDRRQKNSETTQTFLTMALFVYGFVAVIAMISILNIMNTISTSIAARIRYLGVLRAVGMTAKQLSRMVVAEAVTFAFSGFLIGSIGGIALQKYLISELLSPFKITWHFPWIQIIAILVITLSISIVSTIYPIKQIRSKGISEVISSF